MPFESVTGLPGQVFIPDSSGHREKKYPCPNCHCCQMCSESRCRVCRKEVPADNLEPGLTTADPRGHQAGLSTDHNKTKKTIGQDKGSAPCVP